MKKLKAVLLVDDDSVCSWLNKTILEELQVIESIECLYNGEAALDYLTKITSSTERTEAPCPDIIFLDLNMPVVDGFEFLDRLSQIASCRHLSTRVVMLSSSYAHRDISRAANHDIHCYLVKPLTIEKALEVVQSFLDTALDPNEG